MYDEDVYVPAKPMYPPCLLIHPFQSLDLYKIVVIPDIDMCRMYNGRDIPIYRCELDAIYSLFALAIASSLGSFVPYNVIPREELPSPRPQDIASQCAS